jgi:hypothetical protein
MIGNWFLNYIGRWFGYSGTTQETTLLYNPTIEIVPELSLSIEPELFTIEQSGIT